MPTKALRFLGEVWDDMRRFFWIGIICCVFGFGLGKMFTYSDIAADCKILGNFRINHTAFGCRMSES